MKTGIIFHDTFPPYNRGIDQLAQSLSTLGYEPMIISRSKGNDKMNEVNGVPLIQIPKTGKTVFYRYLYHHFPFNPIWANLIVKLGVKHKWGKIIIRDLPLAGSVVLAAKKLGIPAYMDLRENHAAMYKTALTKNKLFQFTHNTSFVQLYENATIHQFQHIFTVSEGLRKWVTSTYKIDPNKISVLENTPNEIYLTEAENAIKQKQKTDDCFRLVYAGYLEERKGLGDVIKALPLILKKYPKVKIRIIGEGDFLPKLKAMINHLELSEAVEIFPMLNLKDLAKAIADCDIGLETCLISEHTNQTIPGKIFEYMALGLPVISSARKSVKEIIEQVGCGRVYSSREPESIANVIKDLISNENLLTEMGLHARNAILTRYNWQYNLNTLKIGLS